MRIRQITILIMIGLVFPSPAKALEDESQDLVISALVDQFTTELTSDADLKNKAVMILPFESSGGRSAARGLGDAAAMLLTRELTREEAVSVVEREKMEQLIEELSLSESGLTSGGLEIGELLNADLMIGGAVADLETRFLIAARLIEVETGKILRTASTEVPVEDFLKVSSELVVMKRYPVTAAFRSLIVPGWGQFYNDRPGKGSVILGTEALLATSTIISFLLYKQSLDSYERAESSDAAQDSYQDVQRYALMNWTSLGAMGILWAYNVIDSFLESRSQIKSSRNTPAGGE